MSEVMDPIELGRLKAVLPANLYYSSPGPDVRQGLYDADEHDLVMPIHGSPTAQAVLTALLIEERQRGRDEGRGQVYGQLAKAIGMDVELKTMREELRELEDRMMEKLINRAR